MAQHDFVIDNQGFPAFRSDLNNVLSAIVTNSSAATEPSTTYAYQWWYDTSTDTLKMRNADDDAWITIGSFDQTGDTFSPISGLTATASELNILDGATLTTTELNYVDGVTSAIQTQLDAKAALAGATFTGTVTAPRGYGATNTDTSNTGNVTLDFATYQNHVLTLTGNVTLDNPSTEAVGQSGFIVFIQDATGGRTVSLGTDYETAGGAGLTLSSAASATDIVPYIVAASGRILLGAPQLAFA